MSYHDDHATDDVIASLGEWRDEIDSDGPTYRCPDCGAVAKARLWAWYGWAAAPDDEPMPPERECSECGKPLGPPHEINGHPCGDCGKDVCELGTDYCIACNAAHDAAEQADPLHHHVWQSNDEWEAMGRAITMEQEVKR